MLSCATSRRGRIATPPVRRRRSAASPGRCWTRWQAGCISITPDTTTRRWRGLPARIQSFPIQKIRWALSIAPFRFPIVCRSILWTNGLLSAELSPSSVRMVCVTRSYHHRMSPTTCARVGSRTIAQPCAGPPGKELAPRRALPACPAIRAATNLAQGGGVSGEFCSGTAWCARAVGCCRVIRAWCLPAVDRRP